LLRKVGVRKDLICFEQQLTSGCGLALGTNIWSKSDAVIMLTPHLHEMSKDPCMWLLKHEISHIKHNDNLITYCVSGACQLAASIYGMCSLSFFPALGLAYSVGILSKTLFRYWSEMRADNFAIVHSSDNELSGGKRLLKAMQKTIKIQRTSFWKRCLYSSSGENRVDIFHPSLTSRIQKIEKALHTRGVKLNAASENKRTEILKEFLTLDIETTQSILRQNGMGQDSAWSLLKAVVL